MVYLSGIKLEYISQIQEVGVILFMVYLFYILSIFNPLKVNELTAYSLVQNKRPPDC